MILHERRSEKAVDRARKAFAFKKTVSFQRASEISLRKAEYLISNNFEMYYVDSLFPLTHNSCFSLSWSVLHVAFVFNIGTSCSILNLPGLSANPEQQFRESALCTFSLVCALLTH